MTPVNQSQNVNPLQQFTISLDEALKSATTAPSTPLPTMETTDKTLAELITTAVHLHEESLGQEQNGDFATAFKTAKKAFEVLNEAHIRIGQNPALDKIIGHNFYLADIIQQKHILAVDYNNQSKEAEANKNFTEALALSKKALEAATVGCGAKLGDDPQLDEVISNAVRLAAHYQQNLSTIMSEVNSQMDRINTAEAAFKEAAKVPDTTQSIEASKELATRNHQLKDDWIATFNTAFAEIKKVIASSDIPASQMPREAALKLTELLTRFGITLYSSKYQQAPHAYNSSLFVFKFAFLMQQYTLGLSENCPDITQIEKLQNLFDGSANPKEIAAQPTVFDSLRAKADAEMDMMSPGQWAGKVDTLTQDELFQMADLLSCINGAMRYLDQLDATRCDNLLQTVQMSLLAAQNNTNYDAVAVKDRLAEFIYNEMTGHLGFKIGVLEKEGKTEEANSFKTVLQKLWSYCIILSKDPALMRARCANKRTFVEDLSPDEVLALRQEAVAAHLSIPEDKRNTKLLALAYNNLSWTYEKRGDLFNAHENVKQANKYAFECFKQGDTDVQLMNVMTHALEVSIKFGELMKQKLQEMTQTGQAAQQATQN